MLRLQMNSIEREQNEHCSATSVRKEITTARERSSVSVFFIMYYEISISNSELIQLQSDIITVGLILSPSSPAQ